MRRVIRPAFFLFCILVFSAERLSAAEVADVNALSAYSDELTEFLLTLKRPVPPLLVDGSVVFTLPSTYRRTGVAFAHEDFAEIHWFKKLELPIENPDTFVEKSKVPRAFYHDSGISFTVYEPPAETALLEYRLIADGLWISDPNNVNYRLDGASGVKNSLFFLDPKPQTRLFDKESPGLIHFSYDAPPGETVTLAGSFNNWDPFMYQLSESGDGGSNHGRYSMTLNLPAGTYHYVFFHRGERRPDPASPASDTIYLRDGGLASVLVVK
jgi:hypothetical protein